MKKKQITLSKKIGEIKKLKKLFQKVCNLLNDPIEMKDTTLRNEAYHEACSNIQERMLNRSKQCLGFSSRPLLHRSPLHTIDEQRKWVEDAQLREAEKIYRSKNSVYAKAVDQYQAEITNLLTEIENCYYFLQDTFQAYPWIKGTLLAGNFEYFRKNYESINKRWFVGEITGVLENLNSIQYALEREQKPKPISDNAGNTKTKERIALKDFIKKHCDLSERPDIDSKCEMLMREHRKDSIKLPLVNHKYRRGQTKLYYLEKLRNNWPDYRITLTTLPPLKKVTTSNEK